MILRDVCAAVLRRVPFPGRSRVVSSIHSFFGPMAGFTTVPLYGGGKLLIDVERSAEMYYTGCLDWNVQHYLLSNCAAGAVVLDIGASIGEYTVPLAHHVGPSGHVYAFEVLPVKFQLLEKNIRLNQLANVTPIHCALGQHSGELAVPFRDELVNYSLASKADRTMTVPAMSLDEFIEKYDLSSVALISMDAEGSEGAILKGGYRTLQRRKVRALCCEINPVLLELLDSSAAEVYALLKSAGYRIHKLTRLGNTRHLRGDEYGRLTNWARSNGEKFEIVATSSGPVQLADVP